MPRKQGNERYPGMQTNIAIIITITITKDILTSLGNMLQSQRVIWLMSKGYKGSKAAKIKGVFYKIVKQTQFLKLTPPSKCVYLVLWHKSV